MMLKFILFYQNLQIKEDLQDGTLAAALCIHVKECSMLKNVHRTVSGVCR